MVVIKTEKEIAAMREGGKILAGIMEEIGRAAKPGTDTETLDKLAERLVFSKGGKPAFKGHESYPATLCVSLNNEIVHGLPAKNKIIKEGDLVKIDIGMKYGGMITDMARTFEIGAVSETARKLARTTKECLEEGIKKIRAGASLNEYGVAVEKYVRSRGFTPVRDLVGHGVGKKLHEDPQVFNYSTGRKGLILKEGMTLALEPMINAGTHKIKFLADGWTIATEDGKLSAHFEDTVAVGKKGARF